MVIVSVSQGSSDPHAEGRQGLLLRRWELGRGHWVPRVTHSLLLGHRPGLLIQYFPVHQHIWIILRQEGSADSSTSGTALLHHELCAGQGGVPGTWRGCPRPIPLLLSHTQPQTPGTAEGQAPSTPSSARDGSRSLEGHELLEPLPCAHRPGRSASPSEQTVPQPRGGSSAPDPAAWAPAQSGG